MLTQEILCGPGTTWRKGKLGAAFSLWSDGSNVLIAKKKKKKLLYYTADIQNTIKQKKHALEQTSKQKKKACI